MIEGDPASIVAIAILGGAAAGAALLVYLPLAARLARLGALRRRVEAAFAGPERPAGARRYDVDAAFRHSPLAPQWEEFLRRWFEARTPGDDEGRAPVRLRDVLDEAPVLPAGPRSALLPTLPGLLVAAGALATFAALARLAPELGSLAADPHALAPRLVPPLWSASGGLALGIGAALVARWMEGRARADGDALDRLVARAYGRISAGELTARAAGSQREATDLLRADLARVLDTGLERIESSTAAAASLVSNEQRDGLRRLVEVLADELRRGVHDQVNALRGALERTTRHQEEVAAGLGQAFDRMNHAAATHRRLTEALEQACQRVEAASRGLVDVASHFEPVAGDLRTAGGALERTTSGLASAQESAAATLEALRASLEEQARAAREQRELMESGLGALRDGLGALGERFGENAQRGEAVLERLVAPLAATEALATELGRTVERVAAEIGMLGTRMGQSMQPIRTTLVGIEDRSGAIARTLSDFRDRAQDAQKTMDALRGGLGEEAREFRMAAIELGRQIRAALAATAETAAPTAAPAPATEPAAAPAPGAGEPLPSEASPAPPPEEPAALADEEPASDGPPAQPPRPGGDDDSQGLSELLRARRPDEPAALRGREGQRRRLLGLAGRSRDEE